MPSNAPTPDQNPYQSPKETGKARQSHDLHRRSVQVLLIGLALLSFLSALLGVLRYMRL